MTVRLMKGVFRRSDVIYKTFCLLRSEESNLHMRKINVVYIMNLPTLVIRNIPQNDKGPLDLKGNRPTNF